MKFFYSIHYPHTMCKGVHKTLFELISSVLTSFNVNMSYLSTISSTEYYAIIYNSFRHFAVFSTNSLCL